MVKVLVVGANGYIGFATAQALRRAGHTVYGLVRTKAQTKSLLQNEIIPIVGDASDIKSFSAELTKVSVVIDTVLDWSKGTPGACNLDLLNALAAISTPSNRKTYIYTSGCLIYGDHPNKVLEEDDPLSDSKNLQWRIDVEKKVISNTSVHGIAVRPGWVYGGTWGNYLHSFFKADSKGQVEVSGNPDKRWSWIHIDDCAAAFVALVEAPSSVVGGNIFNIGDSTRATVTQIKEACARAAGITGPVVNVPAQTDPFSQISDVSCVASSAKLERYTGWKARKGSFLDELPIAYLSYAANQSS